MKTTSESTQVILKSKTVWKGTNGNYYRYCPKCKDECEYKANQGLNIAIRSAKSGLLCRSCSLSAAKTLSPSGGRKKGKITVTIENALPFDECRKYARSLGLKNKSQWKNYFNNKVRPSGVPTNVQKVYQDNGWVDWQDFLGYATKIKKTGMYWGIEQEQAARDYITASGSMELRNKIFEEKLKFPCEKLVECVFNTFKFDYQEVGSLDVQKDVLGYLTSKLDMFDPSHGSKAFSYYSIVVKNYLIAMNNNNYKRFQLHLPIYTTDPDIDRNESVERHVELQTEDPHYHRQDVEDFSKLMIQFWETNIPILFKREDDKSIANAIVELFRHSSRIEVFNKKSLYLSIREISGVNTQKLTRTVNMMKHYQKRIQKEWIETGKVNMALIGNSLRTDE